MINIKNTCNNNINTISFESIDEPDFGDSFPLEIPVMTDVDNMLTEGLTAGHYNFIIDLNNISYMCSFGLSVFFNSHRKFSNNEGKIVFLSPNPTIIKLFSTLKVINVFEIYQDEIIAIQSFSNKKNT